MSERELDLLVDKLVARIQEGNTFFLNEIGKILGDVKKLSPSQAQELIQLLKYGGNYEEIVAKLSEYFNGNIKEVDKIFRKYAEADLQFAEEFYRYRNIPFVEYANNTAIRRQTEALARIVKKEMYDYTRKRMIGYSIADINGNIKFMGLKDVYNRLLDVAFVNVGQGKDTYNMAISRMIKQLGGSGLKTVDYESGRSIRLDSVVRMHVKSRVSELHNEIQDIIGEEIDTDGWEISVHSNPAPDHEKVQGRQFYVKDYEKLQLGDRVKDVKGNEVQITHSKSGTFRPISELNCYHVAFSIIVGVNKPQYSEKELQKIIDDNNKGFEFEGKHYTNYQGTQLQRQYELALRKQKDIKLLAQESNTQELVDESNKKIRLLGKKYRQLCVASGLPSHIDRAGIVR